MNISLAIIGNLTKFALNVCRWLTAWHTTSTPKTDSSNELSSFEGVGFLFAAKAVGFGKVGAAGPRLCCDCFDVLGKSCLPEFFTSGFESWVFLLAFKLGLKFSGFPLYFGLS